MIDEPGIYVLSAAHYHADPCPAPSLSSSIARVLLASSPQHAWWKHPRLNAEYEPEGDDKFDLGTAAHAYLLEGDASVVVVEADDWRKKNARRARGEARMAGKVALLAGQWARVPAMADAARRQLAAYDDPPTPLTAGTAEQTLIWREGDVWCRARLDWLHDDRRVVDDYKTTNASANPDAFGRTLFGIGYDIQAAFYLRGLRALGHDAVFRFVVQEAFAPYALSVIGLEPAALALAERKVAHAIEAWRYCLETGRWPAYPTRTCWIELPPWEETRWMEREARGRTFTPGPVVDDGRDLADQLIGGDAR